MENDRSGFYLQDKYYYQDAEVCHRLALYHEYLDHQRRSKNSSSTETYVLIHFAFASLTSLVPDGDQLVPYTIWGNNLKVVLRIAAELTYHDVSPNARPLDVVKTKWVNYIFADETGNLEESLSDIF